MEPFEKLVKICPLFVVENKTSIPQTIYLKDNDSIHVMGNARTRIKSERLLNLPDSTVFRLVQPTLEQLIDSGIVTSAEAVIIEGDPAPRSKKTSVEDTEVKV